MMALKCKTQNAATLTFARKGRKRLTTRIVTDWTNALCFEKEENTPCALLAF